MLLLMENEKGIKTYGRSKENEYIFIQQPHGSVEIGKFHLILGKKW